MQLNINDAAEAKARQEEGLAAIETTDREFVIYMRKVAKDISRDSGFVSSDNLRVWAQQYGLAPKHANTWGVVFKERGWREIQRVRSKWPSNHNREIRVWEWKP